jgi:outer membrane murein-binding lipoprotein Lpp
MKTKNKFLSVIATLSLLLLVSGCVNRGWQGMVPGKNVYMKNFSATVSTPWGTQTMKADELKTTVSEFGPEMIKGGEKE